nr:class IV adenylate cyclase [Candidatus Gracilibacteria bacterium]
MFEKEIKILDIDKNSLIKKLEEIGAVKDYEEVIHDIYYDYPEGKIDEGKRSFRIRKKGNCYMYTIKKKEKSETIKICQEKEIEISNIDGFQKTLEKYGLVKAREKQKMRLSYYIDDTHFDIDDYEGIPTLLEIEAHSDEEIEKWIKELGLENHTRKTFGSRGLFEYYKVPYKNL